MRFTVMETIYPQVWALIIIVSMVYGSANHYDRSHISDTGRYPHPKHFGPTSSPIISPSLFDPVDTNTIATMPPSPPSLPLKPPYCPVYRNSIKLNFSNMSIGRFDNGVIGYREVISLNLSRNSIKHLPEDAFINLPHLEVLDLSFNEMPVEDLLRFKNLTRLMSLYVDNNNGSKKGDVLSETGDAQLPYLQKLSLGGNRITDFTVSLKRFAPRLGYLLLPRNKISSVEFLNDVPSSLLYLVLDDNKINRIENENLNNLLELSMNRNELEVVCIYECSSYSLQLRGMRRLKTLLLAGNKIKRIELGHNNLQNYHSPSLQTLDLSYNQLTEIPSDIVGEFRTVRRLLLGHNEISEIPKVCSLKELETLDLSGNKIAIVPTDSFCNIMLHQLNLSDNQLTTIHSHAFNIGTRTLDLSSNKLSKLVYPWITHPGNVHTLHLRNNSIANFDDINLTGMSNLRELYITQNPLTHIVLKSIMTLSPDFHIYFHDENDCIVGNSVQNNDDDDDSSGW